MNLDLARKVLNAITTKPEHFDMEYWHEDDNGILPLLPDQQPACGTTMCIAGWAVHLSGYILHGDNCSHPVTGETGYTDVIASKLLDLQDKDFHLFYTSGNDRAVEVLRTTIDEYDE